MATREGLYEALDRFRDALAARDAARLEWSPALRHLGWDNDRKYPEPETLFDDFAGRS